MPRPKRHALRCHSTPTEPPVEPEDSSNVATRSEPVPDSLPEDEPDFPDDAEQCNEPNIRPSRRESNKYWTVDLKDENGEITKAHLRVNDVYVLLGGKKVVLEWNKLEQPIRESGGLLGQFLGHIASEFTNFPISYSKWSKIPSQKKYIMGSLGKKWRDNRSRLFTELYDPALSWEDNLQKRPAYIPVEQWAAFLQYRMEEKTQSMTEKNIINKSKQNVPHTLGSMSIARKRDQIEMETGRTCTRADMYAISHKKNDGSYVNDEARQKIFLQEELQMQSQLSSEDDAYTTIFGKEHPERVRTVGQGVCPSQMFGSTSRAGESSSSNYILKAEFDANIETMTKRMEKNNAEIKSLKNAFAYMMQHMRGSLPPGFPNINQVEDLGSPAPAQTRGDFRRSSSNSHDPQRNDSSSQHD
ncbi:hypothetical protein CDL12_08022 [Handroanthus impetiginosus]|uniref:Transposase Tnp1/En/Spm-like domain-containing protein n=1 Tax=Handroanthus impetiginosus TaxID=429701 RepID=A0A2G9HP55_9LAMI|nr:hypothetical protein CDL12_08022 [Handroanthus impetiginosus]